MSQKQLSGLGSGQLGVEAAKGLCSSPCGGCGRRKSACAGVKAVGCDGLRFVGR